MRRYMLDFVQLFAPHITDSQIEQTRHARSQDDIDILFENTQLPLRSACSGKIAETA